MIQYCRFFFFLHLKLIYSPEKASGADVPKIDVSKLKESAILPKKGGETVVGHALQKHAGRNPDIWGKIKGNAQEINKTAMRHLEEILNAPGDFKVVKTKNGVSFLEKQLQDGRGIRLNMDGSFKGFIDQIRYVKFYMENLELIFENIKVNDIEKILNEFKFKPENIESSHFLLIMKIKNTEI